MSDTLACLESLQQAALHRASSRRCRQWLDRRIGRRTSEAGSRLSIEIIEAGRNLGYAGGNNLGIRYALDHGAEFILILNNDTIVDPMLLDELLAAANSASRCRLLRPVDLLYERPGSALVHAVRLGPR